MNIAHGKAECGRAYGCTYGHAYKWGLATPTLCCALMWTACAAAADDATVIEEPAGYRMDDYRSPTPASLRGATTVNARELHELLERRSDAALIDVLPLQRKPPDFPPERLWRTPARHSLPGSVWLPNVGDGEISPAFEAYFIEHLDRLTADDEKRPLVFYCLIDCWMSWNSAKRALALGYQSVYWFPGGSDEWELMGYPLEVSKPVKMPQFRER